MLLHRLLENLSHVSMSSVLRTKIVHKSHEIKSEAYLSEETIQAYTKKSFLVNNLKVDTINAIYSKDKKSLFSSLISYVIGRSYAGQTQSLAR